MTAVARLGLVAPDCPDRLALGRFHAAISGWASGHPFCLVLDSDMTLD